MTKKIKFMNVLSSIVIAVALILLFYIGYLLMWPYTPAKFGKTPFPVLNKTVKQGDMVRYHVEYYKLMDIPVTTQQMLIDHTQISFPPTSSKLPKGNYDVINHDVFIPSYVTPGKAYINVIFTFKVNSIREIVLTARTEEFEIIAK